LTLNYQKIQPSDCKTQLSVTGIVVKSTPVGVRIISSLTKKSCQSINQKSAKILLLLRTLNIFQESYLNVNKLLFRKLEIGTPKPYFGVVF